MPDVDPIQPNRLVLASQSPRRAELLREAGFDFEIHPANVNEEDFPTSILPADLALLLSKTKALDVAPRFPEHVILAADTVVAFGDQILNKPRDAMHARQMISLLSGTTQVVITGVTVALHEKNLMQSFRVMSAVRMKKLTLLDLDNYVASNMWQGKAGGYGIQDQDPFVVRIAGEHTNIVGLPMPATIKLLAEFGVVPVPKPKKR